jgi:ADP-ribosylglycohydrolase
MNHSLRYTICSVPVPDETEEKLTEFKESIEKAIQALDNDTAVLIGAMAFLHEKAKEVEKSAINNLNEKLSGVVSFDVL